LPAAKEACPDGWHLPSDEEWKKLELHIGLSPSEVDKYNFRGTDEGQKLKSTTGWALNGNGNNETLFTALPGGMFYEINGIEYIFGDINAYGYWW